ncbi:transcriptional regulator [Lebetimonas natsushimae]|uniref:Transcriptional regulator n=1 Tax=Lebetimonas natsushimae TaxID=1936991 RepID=A0A292YCW6_9BACT|nr:bacterio-opsin activator [Lebetimonas natsushimae]GAX87273.1 transcriptional regulator [Lebetimonas natsushimae]
MILNVHINTEENIKYLAERVFFKSIDLLGGLDKLSEYRTLTWLPSIARAAFAIVLKEEFLKTEDEIAEFIGLTRNTVRAILRADPNLAMYKLEHFDELTTEEKQNLKVHTAGGIAKLAYKLVKEGQDSETLMEYCRKLSQEAVAQCDTPWAYLVLKNIKGVKYPIQNAEDLKQIEHLEIKGIEAKEILPNLHYPIKNPALLLKEIKEYLQMKGL